METGNETLAEGQPADDKLVTKLRFVMPQSAKLRFARSSRVMKRSFMDWGVAKRSLATSGEDRLKRSA